VLQDCLHIIFFSENNKQHKHKVMSWQWAPLIT